RPRRSRLEVGRKRIEPRVELRRIGSRCRQELGARELRAQPLAQTPRVVAELREADASLGCGEQQPAEGGGAGGGGNAIAGAAGAIGTRRHADAARGHAVQPARRAEAGAVNRTRYILALLQRGLEIAHARGILIRLWRDAECALEEALKSRRRQADASGQML